MHSGALDLQGQRPTAWMAGGSQSSHRETGSGQACECTVRSGEHGVLPGLSGSVCRLASGIQHKCPLSFVRAPPAWRPRAHQGSQQRVTEPKCHLGPSAPHTSCKNLTEQREAPGRPCHRAVWSQVTLPGCCLPQRTRDPTRAPRKLRPQPSSALPPGMNRHQTLFPQTLDLCPKRDSEGGETSAPRGPPAQPYAGVGRRRRRG